MENGEYPADYEALADLIMDICYNNTIYGTRYTELPKTDAILVADISSCVMSEEIDVTKFGLLFAGANNVLMGKRLPDGVDDGILTAKEIQITETKQIR